MIPLQLPQSVLTAQSFMESPQDVNGWNTTTNLNYFNPAMNPIQQSPPQQQQRPMQQVPQMQQINNHQIINNNHNMNAVNQPQSPQIAQPLQSQAPIFMDPHSYSQHQYQLQFQQLLQQHQQQQVQLQQMQQLQQLQQTQQLQQLQPIAQPSNIDLLGTNQTAIEKIFLNAKFVSAEVFKQLSTEIPKLSPHDCYEGFFVCPNPTGYEWDMVLKVFYKNIKENKTYIKYYLVHEEFCLRGDRCADSLIEAKSSTPNCVQIDLEVPYVLFVEFDHIVSFMYGNEIYIGDSHLIALYVLIERLKVNGGLLEKILYEIRRCCDKFHCVPFLLKAEELLSEDLVWLCGDAILQNLATISYHEWLSIPVTAFTRLIFQAVSGGIEKYSDFIVCELIVAYIKATMSESHNKAQDIVRHLTIADITSVSLEHSLPMLKICDVLFVDHTQKWRLKNIGIYQLSIKKISSEFTPYHTELCTQLQGLSPITFSKILISAQHLLENALVLALEAYKDGNHAAYYNDKHLRIPFVLGERKNQNNPRIKSKSKRKPKTPIICPSEMSTPIPSSYNIICVNQTETKNVSINGGVGEEEEEKESLKSSDSDNDVIVPGLEIMNDASNSYPLKSPSKSPEYSTSMSYEYSPYGSQNETPRSSMGGLHDYQNSKDCIIGGIMIGGDLNQNLNRQSPLTKRSQSYLQILPDDEDNKHNALISKLLSQ